MSPFEIRLVRDSLEAVLPIADQAGSLFYQRLFELDPSLRGLFTNDLAEQSRKLMQMLKTVVSNLDRLEVLVPAAEALAVRHNRYGVLDQHYPTVGSALLWTLREGLGKGFTPDVEAAWVSAYALLSRQMIAAAGPARKAEAETMDCQATPGAP